MMDSIFQAIENASKFYFLFELALIILVIKVMGHLSTRIGQPSVFGKLLVGIILSSLPIKHTSSQ